MTRSPAEGRYLAFDVAVLRRLKFESVAFPFAGGPELGWYLKLWRKRVFANDIARWAWWSNRALVENNLDRLGTEDAREIVDGLEAPAARADSHLGAWLAPEDAAWFSALRERIETVEASGRRALAIRAAFRAMDYAIAVPPGVGRARGLASVFSEVAAMDRPPVDNGAQNVASNLDAEAFLARARADLLFLHVPSPAGPAGWRSGARGLYETWLRGSDDFWAELTEAQRGRLGGAFQSKRAYLEAVDRFLRATTPFQTVVVRYSENGWLTSQEMAERVASQRRVRVAYSRDFTAAAGGRRAHVLVAS